MSLSPLTRPISIAASVLTAVALMVTGLVASPALADTAASPPLPTTVSADVLPTPQINGVVWNVAVAGTTAYAVGSFTTARPAGAAAGTQQVTRNNAMAFNVTTGAILPWNPNLGSQGRSVKVSPDGTKLYIGGDFNTVSGQARSKLAAFNLPSGAYDTSFKPNANGAVVGIAVSDTTVYIGGSFASAGGQARANLAAFNRSNGAVTAWTPTADDIVQALAVQPDSSRVIVGGRFQNLNTAGIVGIGAVDGASGATQPWSSRPIPTRQGTSLSWVTDMTIDNGVVYASGNGEGGHWFDGRFAASFATGDLIWLDNCYGATYGVAVISTVLYSVSHAHDCTPMGTFPQQNPSVWKRALAETTFATGTDQGAPGSNMNISKQPIPTMLNWYPEVNAGTYTGISQGGWSLGTNGNYLVMGGEFTRVNGVPQQGLATFASRTIAPNKIGPAYSTALKPTVLSLTSGTARIAFTGTSDPDDATLTYQVLRDNSTTPIYSTDVESKWWSLPQMGFVDSGLVPGSTHTYRIQVKDPSGNGYIGSRSDVVTISTSTPDAYTQLIGADGASAYWPLNEPSGTAVYDNVGFNDATAGATVGRGAAGAITGDSASTFTGATTSTVSTRSAVSGPNTFTVEAWFKTTSTEGGKIVGFGDRQTGNSGSYDRHVYLDGSGLLTFGVYPGGVQAIATKAGYNDGQWHLVTASLGADGMKLYVDGIRSAMRSNITSAQDYSGYWRIGGDNTNGWPNTGSNAYFSGAIDNVAVYPNVLASTTVLSHYIASGRTSTAPAAPADAYGKLVYQDNPDLYWRLDDAGGATAGDSGITGNSGTIKGGIAYDQPGALSGNVGNSFAFNGSNAFIASSTSVSNPTVYSQEIWFNTTTTSGGTLIGLGDNQTGTSSGHDRDLYMQNDGRLVFGTWTGQTNLAITPNPYNDGQWHHAVATQSEDGIRLYVDGALVATNPQTRAQSYTGYWKVGGETTWNSASSFFNGRLDEAAVYSTALTASRILTHYQAGAGIAANTPPVAAFTVTSSGLTASVDGSGSTDPDGTIASYAWDFGDGATGTGATATHPYAAAGTYTVTLTATDNQGATNATTHPVEITAPNVPPVAALTITSSGLTASVDGSGSTDPDGTIASYAWDFGDGATGTGATATHSYATAGTYTVTLTVTDNQGATNAKTHSLTVTAPANVPPVASFTSTSSALVANFDGSGSSAPGGSIASYSWDFGDSGNSTDAKPTHTYAAAGTYTVTLTVTDNLGATNATTNPVTISATAPPTVYAQDAFGRAVATGFGSADLGGAWSTRNSAAFSVAEGVGKMKMANPGSGPSIYLNSVNSTDTEVAVSVGLDKTPTGNGVTTSVIARGVSTQGDYRASLIFLANGTVSLGLSQTNAAGGLTAVSTNSVLPSLNYSVGDTLNVRVQVVGTSPTTINARVWKNGTAEPTTWQKSATDSTAALQASGRIGFFTYLSGSSTNSPVQALWDNLVATEPLS